MTKITAIIPTFNEESNIQRALDSVDFADEIIVIDSFSTDKTVGIVKESRAILLQRKFDEGVVDVFIHDKEILQYLVTTKALVDVKLAPLSLVPQDYAIAFPEGSALREPVNRSLLSILDEEVWQTYLNQYLGTNE